jgi:DNA-binding NarL/FixJ family response regulator
MKQKEKTNQGQWNYLDHLYNELVEDIERTRYENRNLSERLSFYKMLLQNIPALFVIIDLEKGKITWKNHEFDLLIEKYSLNDKDVIEQVNYFYQLTRNKKASGKSQSDNEITNTGIFKVKTGKNDYISYYFKAHTIKYNQKNQPRELFVNAINLSEKIETEYQLEELVKENKRLKNKLALNLLTRREKEIIKLIANGLSSKKIAEELELSFYTVETHRKNILHKIELNNTAELIRFASESGLV